MSLRIWLPLDGDLRNLGCSEVTATASGATVNTSGKIGSCYSFDGSNDFISLSGNTLYNIFKGGSQQFSICFWVYHNDATRAIIFGDYGLSGAIGFNIELTTSHGVRFYWGGSPDKNFNSTSYVTAQGWTHIVITYSGSILNIYRNGILSADSWSGTLATKNKTAGQFYLGRDSRTGTTVLNGRLNDFRIYDHCLSAAEVHEIAQGLVLHYKLDDITYGIEDSSGYNHNAISNGSQPVTIVADTPRHSTSAKFIAGARIATPVAASQYLPVDAITTNIWIKSSNAANRFLSCTESGGWNFESNSGYVRVPLYISGKGYTYCNSSTTTWSSLSDNQWHMLSFTYDRQQLKIYIDGTIDTTADSSYPNINIAYRSNTPLTIGAEAQTLSSPIAGTYVGNISDLRIYCTALSDDAVRQLYELGMKIDNSHNLHAFEVVENNNKISLNNKRQFKCDEVVESEFAKFFKREELVEVHQIIEC